MKIFYALMRVREKCNCLLGPNHSLRRPIVQYSGPVQWRFFGHLQAPGKLSISIKLHGVRESDEELQYYINSRISQFLHRWNLFLLVCHFQYMCRWQNIIHLSSSTKPQFVHTTKPREGSTSIKYGGQFKQPSEN